MNKDLNQPPIDESRRRLAKVGVAGSIILSSLISKGALAVPYRCTVSGQVSGNLSPVGRGTTNCDVGLSPAEWTTNVSNGTFIGTNGVLTSAQFNTVFGNHFNVLSNQIVPHGTVGSAPATLMQVLTLSAGLGMTAAKLDFGRLAVATLLNRRATAGFPLTELQVIDMFNATADGVGTYNYNGALDVAMNRTDVSNYWTYLITGVDHPGIG